VEGLTIPCNPDLLEKTPNSDHLPTLNDSFTGSTKRHVPLQYSGGFFSTSQSTRDFSNPENQLPLQISRCPYQHISQCELKEERRFRSHLSALVPGLQVYTSLASTSQWMLTTLAGNSAWCKDSILEALKAGYRHLDCAWAYGVNGDVGAAIKESGIRREELFITSKFWPHFGAPDNVEICLDHCLKEMDLDYVDLWLAHWPFAFKAISREALLNATVSPEASHEDGGMLEVNGKPIIDWQYTSTNIAKRCGK